MNVLEKLVKEVENYLFEKYCIEEDREIERIINSCISENDLKNTEGYIKYMTILDILNKCACSMVQPKISMKKIKNIMEELEYDEEYIDSVTVDFCNGFKTARNIIAKLISDNYWKREE